eukprot:5397134-Alexandrium_andersonii.AAC.1
MPDPTRSPLPSPQIQKTPAATHTQAALQEAERPRSGVDESARWRGGPTAARRSGPPTTRLRAPAGPGPARANVRPPDRTVGAHRAGWAAPPRQQLSVLRASWRRASARARRARARRCCSYPRTRRAERQANSHNK